LKCPACGASNETAGEHCFSCGKTLFALTEGTIVDGRYELRQMLGRGGMGMVYRAFDRTLEEEIALKILRPDVASVADLTKRFQSEIKLARRVRHRNVCGIYEYGEDGPIHYIAMELVAGQDLKRQLQAHGPLPPAEAWDVAVQIAEGLDAIHHADVVHRDLKAHNIMRDARGVVRVMDFGIAKALGMASGGATVTGQIIGTPEYMSPEQARGDQIDFRSDIYSLGIVVFEIFTGSVPFRGETPIATLFKHIQDPPPIDGRRGIPPRLVPILKRALAKDPAGRYESARAMAAALREGFEKEKAQGSEATAVFAVPTVVASPTVDVRPADTNVSPPTQVAAPRRATPRPSRPAPPPPPPLPPPRSRSRRAPVLIGAALVGATLIGAGLLVLQPPAAVSASPEPAPPVSIAGSTSLSPAPPIMETLPASRPPDTPPPAAPSPRAQVSAAPASAPPFPGAVVTPRPSPAVVARTERVPSPTPAPTVRPPAAVAAPGQGTVRIRVLPWADVEVDGELKGTTPLRPLALSAGSHILRFRHPDFRPLIKRITVRADETLTVEVDLGRDAFPR
jgi:eukaryotic-like serine/threonine-protein kinase